jgi:AraC-like DNA-binding protein
MEFVLTNKSLFSKEEQFPLRGFFQYQHDMAPHQQEFSEITFVLGGEAMHYTQPGNWGKTSTGDVWVIPANGVHGYKDTKNLQIFNLLFVADQLPIPLLELYTHPQYKKLFSKRNDYWNLVGCYPKLHLEENELSSLKMMLDLFVNLQQDLPGKNGIKYGLFMTIISWLCDIASKQTNLLNTVTPLDISQITSFLNKNYSANIGIAELMKLTSMSESTLRRHFRKAVGLNPMEYIRNFRLGIAARLLLNSNSTVKEISAMCGFNNPSLFCKNFQSLYNKTPQEYRLKQ